MGTLTYPKLFYDEKKGPFSGPFKAGVQKGDIPEDEISDMNEIVADLSAKHNLSDSAPIHTHDNGAKESFLDVDFTLIDAHALFALAKVLDHGAKKYAPNNWRGIPTQSHLNHALMHIYAHLADDKQDEHLEHAFCRLMMALGIEAQGGPLEKPPQ